MAQPKTPDSPLLRTRDFRILLVAEGISALGDAVSFTALPILVLALTGSGLAMGIVGAVQTLPDLFFGMIAGALADRSDRKRLMLAGNLGRAFLTALIPISVVLNGPTIVIILVVAAPSSILRALFLAGYTSATPALVGRHRIAQANSYLEAVYSVGFIAGPAIAGLLAVIVPVGIVIAIDAASFVVAAAALSFIRSDLRAPLGRPPANLLADIKEGVDYIRAAPVLRSTILFWGVVSVVSAGLVPALTVHITRDLRLSTAVLGALLSAYGVGTVVGSVLASRVRTGRAWPQLLGGNLGRALALVGIGLIANIQIAALLGFVAGAASSVVMITYITVRAVYSPDALLGRIGSTARSISLGLQPLGMLAAGALIDLTSGTTTLIAMAVTLGAMSLVALRFRSLREASLVLP